MSEHDAFELAKSHSETLTYLAFFGLFAILGLFELVRYRSAARPNRARRWTTNIVLSLSWVITGPFLPISALAAALFADAKDFGSLNMIDLDWRYAFAAGIVLRSFVSYYTHVAMHKVPFLWRIHRVHHLDPQLDVSSTARNHPLEALGTWPLTIAGIVLFGIPPAAVLLYEIFDALMVVFSHANIRLPRWQDRLISVIFVTPDMHRVHHSSFQPQTDSNFGATLAVWDRMFGTYKRLSEKDLAMLKIGLDDVQDPRAQDILWLLRSPFLTLTTRAEPEVSTDG